MLIAAAAAAAALLAGGIALVATGGDDDPPRLDLGAGAAAPAAAGGGDSGRVAESAELTADDMAGTSMMAWVRYVAGDELPDLGGSAPVHRLVADDDDLRRLADHFGVEGEVTDGEGDGMQRTITQGDTIVGRYGASFWYTSGKEYPGSSEEPVASDCEGGEDRICEETAPPPPERPADMPSQAEAEEIVRGIAEAAGLDLTDARVTSYDNITTWGVNIELALDGAVIPGWSVYGTVMAGGEVLDAGGALGSREQLGDYPLDTTRVAIDRLNEQMDGGRGSEEPMIEPGVEPEPEPVPESDVQTDPATQVAPAPESDPAAGGGVSGSEGSDVATSDTAEPAPDEMTIMPVEGDGEPMTVTLRTAELSYAMVGNADGTETYLVPAYLLDGENDRGEEWLDVFAIAVQAEFLGA